MDQPSENKSKAKPAVIVIVVILVAAAAIYFVTRSSGPKGNPNVNSAAVDSNVNAAVNTNTAADSLFVGDDFTVAQPAGWIQGQLPGALASFQPRDESHPAGSAAAKINFKSYIAVTFDNTNGRTLDRVYQAAVDGIASSIPSAATFATSDETVNGLPAKFAAMAMNQQNVAYTVLVVVYFANEKYYVISFNTTTEKWLGYKDKFYDIARSFKLKPPSQS